MSRNIRGRKAKSNKNIIILLLVLMILVTLAIGVAAFIFSPKDKPVKPPKSSSEISSSKAEEEFPDEESREENSDENSEEESFGENSDNSDIDNGDNSDEDNADNGDDEEEPLPPENINYNFPNNMKAMFITAGVDFCKNESDSPEAIMKDIDNSLTRAKEYGMNSVVFTTKAGDKTIYSHSILPSLVNGFDALEYALDKAKEMDFYTYALYDAIDIPEDDTVKKADIINSDALDLIWENLKMFCENYRFDGIILDSYYNETKEDSYNEYIKYGGGIGYENYMLELSKTLFDTCSKAIKLYSPGTQVGMLTEPVWKNLSETDENGSETAYSYTAYYDGNCDTLDLINSDMAHFVMVKAFGSTTDQNLNFEKVVSWWADKTDDTDLQCYVVHASSKAATDNVGWSEYDQLIKQVMVCEKIPAINGSAFDSLSRMIEDPKNSTTNLMKYYNKEINPDHVLKELAVTMPKQLQFETFEPDVTFKGASDPNTEVTINGEKITTDQNGYFSVNFDLKPGDNIFKIVHKGKQINYKIYRRVVIIKEFSPTGNLAVDGEMQITVSALAYADAKITATLAGQTVTMEISDTQDDSTDSSSNYKLFVGTLTAPKATKNIQQLGNIIFSGDWNGMKESKTGANVTVNKLLEIANGNPVEIVAKNAETFPTNVINDYSSPYYYPLPQGTRDYAVGNEIVFNDGKKTLVYYKLASNVRVYKSDIKVVSEGVKNNTVKSASITSDKSYTYLTIDMNQKASYSAKYDGNNFTMKFNYTTGVPSSIKVGTNPLFSSGSFEGETLSLKFAKSGSFIGYTAYYSGDKLVLRFNNPPAVSGSSLKGVRIVVDAGHGGTDPGALGFLPAYPESVITKDVSLELYNELKARGAEVKIIYTTGAKIELAQRMSTARQFNPHLLVSIHANSSANSGVTGTEAYYFYPFGKGLATYAASNVSRALSTTNRGAKYSYMYMTRDSQFPATLIELGFLSNQAEYKKLISGSYQEKMASSIADAITSYLKSVYTGKNYGSESGPSDDNSSSSSGGDDEEIPVDSIEFDREEITVGVGETKQLKVIFDPEDATNQDLVWEVDDPSILSISQNGKIKGLKKGETTVYATSDETGETVECYVIVGGSGGSGDDEEEDEYTGIEFTEYDIVLEVGEKYQLEAILLPSKEVNTNVVWYSEEESICKVSNKGVVTAIKAGTCTIVAETPDGEYYDVCEITVE